MDAPEVPFLVVEAGPEANIQSPEAVTPKTEAQSTNYRNSLGGILKDLIQNIKMDRKLNDDPDWLEDDCDTKVQQRILHQFRDTLRQGEPEDPVSEDEQIAITCRRVQHTLKVIKGLGAESKETNFMIRMALWTAVISYGALAPSKSSSNRELEERDLDEPLIHILLSYVLLRKDHTQLFKNYFKGLGIEVVDRTNSKGFTPLYVAIKNNNLEMVKSIIHHKAKWEKVSEENDSALHAAVGHPVIFKYLSQKYHRNTVKGPYNKSGYAPIHLPIISNQLQQFKTIVEVNSLYLNEIEIKGQRNCLHLAVQHKSVEIVEAIFEILEKEFGYREYSNHIIMTQVDDKGLTPFGAALQGTNKAIIGVFLRYGASLLEKGSDEKTALVTIANRFNDASSILWRAFDDSISISATSDANIIDYSSFTDIKGTRHTSQIEAITQIVEHGQKNLLLHPVIKSYVYLKWNYFLPLIYILISVHGILLITFNVLVANIFYYRDTTNESESRNQTSNGAVHWFQQELDWSYWTLIILMYAIITMLIVQESLTMYIMGQHWRHHFADWEAWIRLAFLVLAIFLPVVLVRAEPEPADWQRNLACAALLLGWLQAMFLLSRFPLWGSCVLMFGTVACSLLKILASMIFLIIGFSFCFMIQYQSEPSFDGPGTAFFKTLVMMLTGFNYDLLNKDNKTTLEEEEQEEQEDLRDTIVIVRQLFGFFIIFVAVTLINLMTNTATSDINELTVMAEKQRVEKQVQLLETMEAVVYNGPYARILKKAFSRGRYYKQIKFSTKNETKWNLVSGNVLEKDTGTGFTMNPPFEVHSLIQLREPLVEISKKKERHEEKKNISITKNKIEELHDGFLKKPDGEEKGNIDWVREAADDLKCNIEDMDSKIEKLISNQNQMSDRFKELIEEIKKLSKTKPINKRKDQSHKKKNII